MAMVEINGSEYPLSTKLRVAYALQEKNNHKPYISLFEGIDEMPIEKQIQMIYISFQLANPEASISEKDFLNYFLDNYGVQYIMNLVKEIIEGVMYNGLSPEEIAAKKAERQQQTKE